MSKSKENKEMALKPKFVGIWPLKAPLERKAVKEVPLSYMSDKNLKPQNDDDFDREKWYRYKPPGAKHSSYVYIIEMAGELATDAIFVQAPVH